MAQRGPKTIRWLGLHAQQRLHGGSRWRIDLVPTLVAPARGAMALAWACSAYPRSHTAPDAIALRSFAPIFEETYRPGRHRVVTAVEAVRDPEHAGAFTVFVARPRNLWYCEFRSVVDARRALSVAGRAKDTICSLG